MDNFYLAHPFEARKIVRAWELLIERFFKINLINPIYDVHGAQTLEIDNGLRTRYENVDFKKLVERELFEIQKKDTKGSFVIQPGNFFSIGAYHEMVYTHNLGKTVYSLIMNGHHEHPWVNYHSNKVFTKWHELNSFIFDNFSLREGFEKSQVLKELSNLELINREIENAD